MKYDLRRVHRVTKTYNIYTLANSRDIKVESLKERINKVKIDILKCCLHQYLNIILPAYAIQQILCLTFCLLFVREWCNFLI